MTSHSHDHILLYSTAGLKKGRLLDRFDLKAVTFFFPGTHKKILKDSKQDKDSMYFCCFEDGSGYLSRDAGGLDMLN